MPSGGHNFPRILLPPVQNSWDIRTRWYNIMGYTYPHTRGITCLLPSKEKRDLNEKKRKKRGHDRFARDEKQ